MSYHKRRRRPAMSGDMTHGPAWYRAMGGVSTQLSIPSVPRPMQSLGTLGDDAPGTTTLSVPTVTDPTATIQWQANVLSQLSAGVATLKKAELQKWLQIIATVSIPLSAAIWKVIFKRGGGAKDPTE